MNRYCSGGRSRNRLSVRLILSDLPFIIIIIIIISTNNTSSTSTITIRLLLPLPTEVRWSALSTEIPLHNLHHIVRSIGIPIPLCFAFCANQNAVDRKPLEQYAVFTAIDPATGIVLPSFKISLHPIPTIIVAISIRIRRRKRRRIVVIVPLRRRTVIIIVVGMRRRIVVIVIIVAARR